MPATVIVIAGPSGSGKSRLCTRVGLPFVNLDNFYKNGSDPTLPRLETGLVDWDDPASWLEDEAVDAIERLCLTGVGEIPVYDIARDGRVGAQTLHLDGATYFVAEGVFAQEVVARCRDLSLVAEAICVSNHRLVTFWRRLTRDLREHRKPPLVLLRRGLRLMHAEPDVIAHAVALGCLPMSSEQAYQQIRTLAS